MRALPAVKPYYAVKCNPEPQFLRLLQASGLGFDCASQRELLVIEELASKFQTKPQILYANPCKSSRDLQTAKELGAPCTVVDSEQELEKLVDYKGGALLRIAVEDSTSCMPFSTKFGLAPEQVGRIGQAAAALQIPIHGISFHIGSGGSSGTAYMEAIALAERSLQTLRTPRGGAHLHANTIDIGGGFVTDGTRFEEAAVTIRQAIQSSGSGPGIRWVAEPGRFFASDSFDFFVQVIGKKAGSPQTGGGWHYTIDDSLYGQFSSILFDHGMPKWIRIPDSLATAGSKGQRPTSPGTLFGRTCDSLDVIARSSHMEELEVGDWLWFPHMGAYTRATASEFNGFPSPDVFISDSGETFDMAEVQKRIPQRIQYPSALSARTFWESLRTR
jgi:ornithine decarboxylase